MKKGSRAKWLGSLLALVVLVLLILPTSVLAIAKPDTHQIVSVDIYRHCLETDDMLVLVKYNLQYTTNPDETITDAYLGRLMDGTDELGSIAPYAFYNSGYDEGAWAIYFTAAEAPTWGGSYSAEFVGNPTLEWTDQSSMEGALAYDAPTYTDQTTEANSAAANDMTLLPAGLPAVGDAYLFGGEDRFNELALNIGTSGDGVWTTEWQYYNGSWVALSGVTDDTVGYTADAGIHSVTFSMPSDWTETTLESIESYWIRGYLSSYTSKVTIPLGTQSWVGDTRPPLVVTTGLAWHATASHSATEAILSLRILILADDLENAWSVNMVDTTASGNTLSTYGEAYFSSVIPDLRSMCPDIFPSGVLTPDFEEEDYTLDYTEQLEGRWQGTGYDQKFQDFADFVGIPKMFLTTILWFLAMGAVGYGITVGAQTTKPMLMLIIPMLIVGTLLGWVPLALTLVIGLICVLLIGYVFFLRTSSA